MDPYSHPSAIPITPKEDAGHNFGRAASSSSSNFDPHLDNGVLYSPAEVRSIDAVHFDAADATILQPAFIPSYTTRSGSSSGGGGGGLRRRRAAEVNIEGDPPSVPHSPLGLAQESARHFSVSAPLPVGAAAPGSPAQSVNELIARYTCHYRGGVEASLHYVLAIMNPSSGEVAVSQAVLAGLRDELGTKRVLALNGDLFADPAPIRLLIKEQAVIYHPPGQPGRQQRGTVVVCGGDGTVSFLMTQMDLVQRELEAEFAQFLTHAQHEQLQLHRDRQPSNRALPDLSREAEHPYFTIPALAPLPLGTGNDYSNCVGFGKGFALRGGGCCAGLWALCGCGDGGGSQVAAALESAVTAPCVMFDRWEVSLVPLQIAQRTLRTERVGSPLASPREGDRTPLLPSPPHPSREKWASPPAASAAAAEEEKEREGGESPCASFSSSFPASSARACTTGSLWNRTVRSSNVASSVNLVDWERLYASKQVSTYGLINYFSVGYDAYVATKFDATRRAYPAVCSTRTQNKAVYVSLGIGGALQCKKLRKLVPMICVPRPSLPDPTRSMSMSVSMNESQNATCQRDLIALQLPSMTKSLVVSNVSCYGAGTHPWNPNGGELYYRPVTLRNGEIIASPVITAPNKDSNAVSAPAPRPVTINDRTFEVQSMGGFLHYSSLGAGLTGSIKLLQTNEMFTFVLCTPEDLQFPSGQCSTYTQLQLKDKYLARLESDASVRASLCVQIDGEAVPSITEPTIIHMRRQQGSRILIRCRNASVVQQ